MDTLKNSDQLKKDIRNWLTRLGVQQSDIQIGTSEQGATVEYMLARVRYTFTSTLQNNRTNNLAAVEQFLHYRVLGIERGIETVEQAFKGYEALTDQTESTMNPYHVLGFEDKVPIETARAKYKELAKSYHPDVNDSDEAKKQFQMINIAMKKIEGDE